MAEGVGGEWFTCPALRVDGRYRRATLVGNAGGASPRDLQGSLARSRSKLRHVRLQLFMWRRGNVNILIQDRGHLGLRFMCL